MGERTVTPMKLRANVLKWFRVSVYNLAYLGLNPHSAREVCWVTLDQSPTVTLAYRSGVLDKGQNAGEKNDVSHFRFPN